MSTHLEAIVRAVAVAGSRGIAISGKILPPHSLRTRGEWAWCATMQAGQRRCTAGSDSGLENAPLHEQSLYMELWLPAATVEVAIDLDVWSKSQRTSWRGSCTVSADAKETLVVLRPGEALRGAPFDQPVAPPGDLGEPYHSKPSLSLTGIGKLVVNELGAEADYSIAGLDGTVKPLPIPRRDPRRHPGFVTRLVHRPPDRIALFRDHSAGQWTVTLSTLSNPTQAAQLDCFGDYGAFDREGTRFWFARSSRSIAILNLATGQLEGEIAVSNVAGPIHLLDDLLFSYRGDDANGRTGLIVAESWSGAPMQTWEAPKWQNNCDFDPTTGRVVWSRFIGLSGPSGARSAVSWLDLPSLGGGESVVPDRLQRLTLQPDGHIRGSGKSEWLISTVDGTAVAQ